MKRLLFLLALLGFVGSPALAQTVINGDRTIKGHFKADTASSTSPNKTGTLANRPATCAVGATYLQTDGTSGLYCCLSTNTWTTCAATTAGTDYAKMLDTDVNGINPEVYPNGAADILYFDPDADGVYQMVLDSTDKEFRLDLNEDGIVDFRFDFDEAYYCLDPTSNSACDFKFYAPSATSSQIGLSGTTNAVVTFDKTAKTIKFDINDDTRPDFSLDLTAFTASFDVNSDLTTDLTVAPTYLAAPALRTAVTNDRLRLCGGNQFPPTAGAGACTYLGGSTGTYASKWAVDYNGDNADDLIWDVTTATSMSTCSGAANKVTFAAGRFTCEADQNTGGTQVDIDADGIREISHPTATTLAFDADENTGQDVILTGGTNVELNINSSGTSVVSADGPLYLRGDGDNNGTGEYIYFDPTGDGIADFSFHQTYLDAIYENTAGWRISTNGSLLMRADSDNDGVGGETVQFDANGDGVCDAQILGTGSPTGGYDIGCNGTNDIPSPGWTDGGALITLTTATDDVTIGDTALRDDTFGERLQIYSGDTTGGGLGSYVASNTTSTPNVLNFRRSRGTAASPSNSGNTDVIGQVNFKGLFNGTFQNLGRITVTAGAQSASYLQGTMNFFAQGTGPGSLETLRMYVDGVSNIPTTEITAGGYLGFEGLTDNEFETFIMGSDVGADRTITLPDATGTVVLADNTATITGKTINVESTGNTVTTVERAWFPAATCAGAGAAAGYSVLTTNAPTPGCYNTASIGRGYLAYDYDGVGDDAGFVTFTLPTDWTGTVDARIHWMANTTLTTNVIWNIQTSCAADGEVDQGFNTVSAVTDANGGTSTYKHNIASMTGISMTNCSGGETAYIRVSRDDDNASDTLAADALLLGVELTYRRAQ